MDIAYSERFRYEAEQVRLRGQGPWLTPKLPTMNQFFGTIGVMMVFHLLYDPRRLSALVFWALLIATVLVIGTLFGLCVLIRHAIKICPWCYESVAGGAQRCPCGFDARRLT